MSLDILIIKFNLWVYFFDIKCFLTENILIENFSWKNSYFMVCGYKFRKYFRFWVVSENT